ncbi:hypothetical protein PtB15_17B1, partial [Puccinia triticina]
MAIWFLYGVGGWWHCFNNPYAFKQTNVFSIISVAHARHEYLYAKGHNSSRRPEETPWYKTDSFIQWVLRKAKVNEEDVAKINWKTAPLVFQEHVTNKNIARFALEDLLAECAVVGPSLGLDGKPALPVELAPAKEEAAADLMKRLTSAWAPHVIADYSRRIEHVIASRPRNAIEGVQALQITAGPSQTRRAIGAPPAQPQPSTPAASSQAQRTSTPPEASDVDASQAAGPAISTPPPVPAE